MSTQVMTVEYATARVKQLTEQAKTETLDPIVLADLGGCYFTLGYPEKALEIVKFVSERIKDPGVLMNLGLIYKDLGEHQKSLRVIEEAFWLQPINQYYRLGYAEGLLRAGFWKQAWPFYDHARPTQLAAKYDAHVPGGVREWKGEPLPEGHKVLVINEGGTGDRLSYARWLPELTRRGVDWVFYPYMELYSFFERIFPREKLVADGDQIVATHWTTTFSLPCVLNAGPNDVPEPLPITAHPDKIAQYAIKRDDSTPILGICYSAGEMHQGGRKIRSLTEGQAMRIVMSLADKVRFVNLQHGSRMPFPVSNVHFESWEDSAGLISNLDGVITVDTGTMHLAAAMGKPTAVLLSGNSCWKFLSNKKKLNLYPSATFYRNEGHGVGMEYAIDQLISDIRNGSWPEFVPAVAATKQQTQ